MPIISEVFTYPEYILDGNGKFHPGSTLISSAAGTPRATRAKGNMDRVHVKIRAFKVRRCDETRPVSYSPQIVRARHGAQLLKDPRNPVRTHMLTILFHASCVTDSPQAASLAHACMAMAATSASTARKAAEAAGLMSGCRPGQALLDACSRLLRYWAVSAHARA